MCLHRLKPRNNYSYIRIAINFPAARPSQMQICQVFVSPARPICIRRWNTLIIIKHRGSGNGATSFVPFVSENIPRENMPHAPTSMSDLTMLSTVPVCFGMQDTLLASVMCILCAVYERPGKFGSKNVKPLRLANALKQKNNWRGLQSHLCPVIQAHRCQ
jgi:hypothetical protein